MQVNLHDTSGNQITKYTSESVHINGVEYNSNIIVSPNKINSLQIKSIDDLDIDLISTIIDSNKPDIIIFGTGLAIKNPSIDILRYLQKSKIGFEVMPIPALCRTFNYLIGEGRIVVGLFVL